VKDERLTHLYWILASGCLVLGGSAAMLGDRVAAVLWFAAAIIFAVLSLSRR
jgi:hypothetical protein